jgi:putative FmdB family regulatory protein
MPLYEYYCPSCNTTFEQLRPMSRSTEPATCPAGHPKAERVVSLVAAPIREGSDPLGGGSMASGCSSCTSSSCATCRP